MSTYYSLKLVIAYMQEYDRNGDFEQVFASIIDGTSTVLEELCNLEEILTEWVIAEKEVGIKHNDTLHYLEIVQDLKEVY